MVQKGRKVYVLFHSGAICTIHASPENAAKSRSLPLALFWHHPDTDTYTAKTPIGTIRIRGMVIDPLPDGQNG